MHLYDQYDNPKYLGLRFAYPAGWSVDQTDDWLDSIADTVTGIDFEVMSAATELEMPAVDEMIKIDFGSEEDCRKFLGEYAKAIGRSEDSVVAEYIM